MDIIIPGINDIEDLDKREYGDAKHERKPHGIIFSNGREVATTLQCPHCGGHFISRKGSGARRTFCQYHMGVTCGNRACDPCPKLAGEIKLGFI